MMNANENMKVFKLNEEELMDVNGGNWLTDAWDCMAGAAEKAWNAT